MVNTELLKLKENRNHGDFILPFTNYYGDLDSKFPLIPMHWHEEIEITIIESGKCNYNIDLKPYLIEAGDIVIIKPHSLHSLKKIDKFNMTWNTIIFNFNMLNSATTDGCLLKYLAPLINEHHELPVVIKSNFKGYDDIIKTLYEVLNCFNDKNIAYELELKSKLFYLLALLYRNDLIKKSDGNKNLSTDASNKIKKVLNYINENYYDNISIDTLANICEYSEYHFMRFFKKHIGMTCIQYINNLRLEKSAILLTTTTKSIMEISFEIGFDNLSYFNKVFKRKYNLTPKEFRQLN